LGRAFNDAVEFRLNVILQLPEAGSYVIPFVRRALIPRFPHCLYYAHDGNDLVFIACLHTSRAPDVWRLRSPN
jgi:hypothetical protein